MNRWLLSAASGFVSTIPMTMVMLKLKQDFLPFYERYPLPPRLISRNLLKKVGMKEKLSQRQLLTFSLMAHFGFGTFAGSIFYPIFGRSKYKPLLGMAYGLGVWTMSYTRIGFVPNAGLLPPASVSPRKRNALMIIAHIVWGGSLGCCVSLVERKKIHGNFTPAF